MMPQKLLFSIGPPALLSFICLEKIAVLYLINISEYQGQINQAATSEFYHSCITHNSSFRTNMGGWEVFGPVLLGYNGNTAVIAVLPR